MGEEGLYEPAPINLSGGGPGETGGGTISEKDAGLYEFAHKFLSGGEAGGGDTDSWKGPGLKTGAPHEGQCLAPAGIEAPQELHCMVDFS
jgi:hypothetical protein